MIAENDPPLVLAERLRLPRRPAALLWDMDGTVLDSLALDLGICNELLRKHLAADVHVSRAFIESIFAFEPPKFWRLILDRVEADFGMKKDAAYDAILEEYEKARNDASFEACPGARDVLEDAKRRGIPLAIVSNNETEAVKTILRRSRVDHFFDVVVGNDYADLKKKPAPDTYLLGAKMLGVDPARSVVVEDSIIGVEAGKNAGAHVVAVATGGTPFDALAASGCADVVYLDLEKSAYGVRADSPSCISTPHPLVDRWSAAFMSSASAAVDLTWRNNDWEWLGSMLFDLLRRASTSAPASVEPPPNDAIDVRLESREGRAFELVCAAGVPASALTARAPSPRDAEAAVRVLQGIARAAEQDIRVTVRAYAERDDAWEAIFRAVGRALDRP